MKTLIAFLLCAMIMLFSATIEQASTASQKTIMLSQGDSGVPATVQSISVENLVFCPVPVDYGLAYRQGPENGLLVNRINVPNIVVTMLHQANTEILNSNETQNLKAPNRSFAIYLHIDPGLLC